MTDEEFEHFHGERRKRGLIDFFNEGTIMNQQSCSENPYWEETKKIYQEQPPRLQKTSRLTAVYYQKLENEHKELTHTSEEAEDKIGANLNDGEDKAVPIRKVTRKRKANQIHEDEDRETTRQTRKKRKIAVKREEMKKEIVKKLLNGNEDSDSNSDSDFCDRKPDPVSVPKGPLLQLPTGSAKVYTRLSVDEQKVWKGPYKRERMNITLFFHKALKTVLEDPHTLDVESKGPYLIFPMLKGANVIQMKTTKKDFTDVIAKTEVKDGVFVLREDLGIVQCHKMGSQKLKLLPMTFWVHFVWRFCLNVGDSGLYNAITDDSLSFLYGIDMEESRTRVAEKSLVGYLFTKVPSKVYMQEIGNCLKKNKIELVKLVNKPINYARLDKLAKTYSVSYDRSLFIERIKLVRHAAQHL